MEKIGLDEAQLKAQMESNLKKVQMLTQNSEIYAQQRAAPAAIAAQKRQVGGLKLVSAIVVAPILPLSVGLALGARKSFKEAAPHAAEAHRKTGQIKQATMEIGRTDTEIMQGQQALTEFQVATQQQQQQATARPAFKSGMGA